MRDPEWFHLPVISGVPQGSSYSWTTSVSHFVNDIPDSVTSSPTLLFADDNCH